MRKIDKIILHCSGTQPFDYMNVESIRKYHVEHNK